MNINKMNTLETAAYAVGLRVDKYNPGGVSTRYRFFRETPRGDIDASYFGGSNSITTVEGRKAAFAFVEAYRAGRANGIREARAEVINSADRDMSAEQIGLRLTALIEHGPWHYGEPVTEAEQAILDARDELIAAATVMIDHASEMYPHFESERGQRDIERLAAAIKTITHAHAERGQCDACEAVAVEYGVNPDDDSRRELCEACADVAHAQGTFLYAGML